jgi:hypothetical protein
VAKKGEAPTDGITDLNPEGLTAAHGEWANDLAATLKGAGLSCHVLEKGVCYVCVCVCVYLCVITPPLRRYSHNTLSYSLTVYTPSHTHTHTHTHTQHLSGRPCSKS